MGMKTIDFADRELLLSLKRFCKLFYIVELIAIIAFFIFAKYFFD